jgi:hypothetical protein
VRDQVPQTYIKHRTTRNGNKKALPKFPLFCKNIKYTVLTILSSLNAKLKPSGKLAPAHSVVERSLQAMKQKTNGHLKHEKR